MKKKRGHGKACGARLFSYGSKELLLLAKAFMKVPCNPKHSTDKKVDNFWEDISLHFEELVPTSNPEYIFIERNQDIDSVCNCCQYCLQPSASNSEVFSNSLQESTGIWGIEGQLYYGFISQNK